MEQTNSIIYNKRHATVTCHGYEYSVTIFGKTIEGMSFVGAMAYLIQQELYYCADDELKRVRAIDQEWACAPWLQVGGHE